MTQSKTSQPNSQPTKGTELLDQLYDAIRQAIRQVHPEIDDRSKWGLADSLYSVVEEYVKQSFRNGIQVGRRQTQQANNPKTDSRASQAQRPRGHKGKD